MLTLVFLVFAGTVEAAQEGYSSLCYAQVNAVTYDGKWTNPTEWTDTGPTNFGSNAAMRQKYQLVSDGGSFVVSECIILETWDNTNDAGDYYEVCIDATMNGGAAPQEDDYRIVITGHGSTATVTWYKGNGAGWATISAIAGALTFAEALDTSPTTAAQHYACEMRLDKTSFGMGPQFWMRVAYYDAHAGGYGLQAWPPTSANTPAAWGDIPYTSEAIPEGFGVGLIVMLSSIAIVAGAICTRNRAVISKSINRIA